MINEPSPVVEYSPDADYFGSDSFTYTVCDDGDGFDDLEDEQCAVGAVSVTVTPVPDAPIADPQIVNTNGDVNQTITLTGSDADGDSLTFTITVFPTQGSIVAGPTQVTPTSATVEYDPNTVGNVKDSFTFQVDDNGNGGTDSAVVAINPSESCSADSECDAGFVCNTGLGICEPAPLGDVEAKADSVETIEDTAVTIQLVGAAPCDPTGAADPTVPCDDVGNDVPLFFTLLSGPTCVNPATCSAGSLSGITQGSEVPRRTATIDYTPATGFNGSVSFVFQVAGDTNGDMDTADAGETSTATVVVSVDEEADPAPPVVEDIASQTPLNTAITLDLSIGSAIGGTTSGPVCGNGTREEGEECDDGNNINGDGCSSICELEGPFLTGPATSSAVSAGDNGETSESSLTGPTPLQGTTPIPITVGAGWSTNTAVPPAFYWSGTIPTLACDEDSQCDGPFSVTLSGNGCVSVTDDFVKRDQFRVIANGQEIGVTPAVAIGPSPPVPAFVGPDAAYTDPSYSSGTFPLGPGTHSLQVELIGNSLTTGRAYIRVDNASDPICDNVIDTSGPRVTYRVQSVPPATEGTLKDSAGTVITAAGYLLPDNLLKFEPASGFTGTVNATYDCIDNFTELISNLGLLDWLVFNPNPGTGIGLTIDFQGTGVGDVAFDVGGSVVAICSADCTESFAAGDIIKLQARPIETSTFAGWGGDCAAGGSSQIYTITLPASGATCTATFNP